MSLDLTLFGCRIATADREMDCFKSFLEATRGSYSSAVLIADTHVFPLYGEKILQMIRGSGLPAEIIVVPAGEPSKSLRSAEICWKLMQSFGLDRRSLVVGLGGGVITDLSGFAASCYMRGIDNIQIPTTLMGMVDAAIGGKTAVNLPEGKNLIGTFHQPKLVVIAPHFLETLPARELHSGLAEAIKCAVIWDETFFNSLESNLRKIVAAGPSQMEALIARTAAIKVEIVGQDEKESGLRAILNWGHTFAHALETMTGYTRFLHGEAVAIGMCCAARVSREMGLVDDRFVERQERLCAHAMLPTTVPAEMDIDEMIKLLSSDKKAVSGKINLILARGLGKVAQFEDVDRGLIKRALLRDK